MNIYLEIINLDGIDYHHLPLFENKLSKHYFSYLKEYHLSNTLTLFLSLIIDVVKYDYLLF